MLRSHMTAFGVGAGLAILVAIVVAVVAPKAIHFLDDDDDGVSTINIGGDDGGAFTMTNGGDRFGAKWKGDFAFAADARSLGALDKSLEVERKDKSGEVKALFRKEDGAIEISAWRDGKKLEGAAADKEAADLLLDFARNSGVKADARVKALIAAGGKKAALDEIAALKSGHGATAYIEALSENATLDDSEIQALASGIGGFEGDYAKRAALGAILKSQSPGAKAMDAILAAAKKIDGDHELRLLIEDLAEGKSGSAAFPAAMTLLSDIKGDHEIRLASEALLEAKETSNANAAEIIEAASRGVKSDYELRLVIDAASDRIGDDAVAKAAIDATDAIKGGHDRRLAIETIADELPASSSAWTALIGAVSGVDGDHDQRLAIETLAEEAPKSDDIRMALKSAAEAIGSDHEREQALDALN